MRNYIIENGIHFTVDTEDEVIVIDMEQQINTINTYSFLYNSGE